MKQQQQQQSPPKKSSLQTLKALQQAHRKLVQSRSQSPQEIQVKNQKESNSNQKNNSPQPLSPPKKIQNDLKELKFYSELRSFFQKNLTKLLQNETREYAMREIQNAIKANAKDQKCLRVFISCLSDGKRADSFVAKELELMIIAYIISIYNENMVDPIDKPPNLLKTCSRILEIILSYFKDMNLSVQKACAAVWNELYISCLGKYDYDTKSLVSIEPLLSIITGGTDRASQTTACLCLGEFLEFLQKVKEYEFIERISSKIIQAFLKVTHDFTDLIKAFNILVECIDIRHLVSKISAIINKLVKIIDSDNPQIAYQSKIQACNALNIIAKKLSSHLETVYGTQSDTVILSLRKASKDKIYKLQVAASQALKQWEHLLEQFLELEQGKTSQVVKDIDTNQLIKMRTGISPENPQISKEEINQIFEKFINNNKNNSNKIGENEKPNSFQMNDISQATTWRSIAGSNEFVRKGTGTGGGQNTLQDQRNQIKLRKNTYNQQKNSLKDVIFGNIERGRQAVQRDQQDSIEKIQNDNKLYHQESIDNQSYFDEEKEIIPTQSRPDNIGGSMNNNNSSKRQNIDFIIRKNNLVYTFNKNNELPRQTEQMDEVQSNIEMSGYYQEDNYVQQQQQLQRVRSQQQNQKNQKIYVNQNYQNEDNLEDTLLFDTVEFSNDDVVFENIKNNQAINKKQSKQSEDEDMLMVWENILKLVEKGQINEAYTQILESGDDIYLLRLMSITGVCLEKLTKNTCLSLISRIILLMKSDFMSNLTLDFFQEGYDIGLSRSFNIDDQNLILETLLDMSNSNTKTSSSATQLYNNYLNVFLK